MHYLPGLAATFGLIIVNMIPIDVITGESYYDGATLAARRTCLFISFVFSFGSLIASIWIMVAGFLNDNAVKNKFPGISIFLQNLFIFLSAMLFKFGRAQTDGI